MSDNNKILDDSVESNIPDTLAGEPTPDVSVEVNPSAEPNATVYPDAQPSDGDTGTAETATQTTEPNMAPPITKQKKKSGKTGKEGRSVNRIIVGIILIAMAVALAVVIVPKVGHTNKTYGVIKVIENIPEGVKLSSDNIGKYFSYATITDETIASSVITGENEVIFGSINGKYITRDIYATGSRFLCREDLADTQTVTNDKVPEGKELVGMLIPSIYGDVGYMPKPGDVIRFYGLKSVDQNGIPNFSVGSDGVLNTSYDAYAEVYELLQYVEIYRVLDGAGIDTIISGATPSNMVIICTTEQVEQLVEAQNKNSVYLSLMSSGDEGRAKSMLKEQELIIERYKFRQEMTDGIERNPVVVPLSTVSHYFNNNYVVYQRGGYVSLGVSVTEEREILNADGTISKKTVTSYREADDLLGCVEVSGIYIKDKAIVDITPEELLIINPDEVSLGLLLSVEQTEALSELMKEGRVVIMPLSEEPEVIAEKLAKADAINRELIIDKLIAEQEAEKEAEEEASEAESSEAESSEGEVSQ